VNDDAPAVSELPPWRLWPERERTLSALADTRDELALRLCRWPLSLRDLERRSGIPHQVLSRLRSQAAQDWPTYRRLDDLTDAAVTVRTARRYARLRERLRTIDARATTEALRCREQGDGWRRTNAALGAPPGADQSWVRRLVETVRRTARSVNSEHRY